MNKHNIYQSYLDEIRRFPLLNFEQELELSRKIQKGDSAAELTLVQCNLRLVVSLVSKYICTGLPVMDLIQEGNLGLLTAVKKYHYGRNVRFSTYACWWITQSITRAVANKQRTIRLPHRKEELLRRVKRSENILSQILARTPSAEEIAVYAGVKADDVQDILQSSAAILSIDSELENDPEQSMSDILPDYTYNPESEVMRKNSCSCIRKILNLLPPDERRVLYYRYNLGRDKKPKTLRRISEELGVSAETVRQMEMRALRRLREAKLDEAEYYA